MTWPCSANEITARPITVVGSLEALTNLEREDGHLTVSGTLHDERRTPVQGRVRVVEPLHLEWQDCLNTQQGALQHPIGKTFRTDQAGRFCLRTSTSPLPTAIQLQIEAPHHETSQLTVTSQKQLLAKPQIVRAPNEIEQGTAKPHLVEASLGEATNTGSRATMSALWLRCEDTVRQLAQKPAHLGELLRFEFTGDAAVTPGHCELSVSASPPDAETSNSFANPEARLSAPHPVLVRGKARVSLEKTETNRQSLRLVLHAEVGAPSHATPLSAGVLEARTQGAFLASCPLERGRCILELERHASEQSVSIHFLPSEEAVLAPQPLTVRIPATSPPILHAVLKGGLLTGFGLWLLYAWLGHRRQAPEEPRAALGRPGVEPIGASQGPISGRVLDAHTAAAIVGATVELREVGVTEERRLEVVTSDRSGGFRFEHDSRAAALLRLKVTASNYMPLEAQVQNSRLSVQLTYRRRAVLETFLTWAQKRGTYFQPRAPTPLQLAALAEKEGAVKEQAWAEAVDLAVYGPQEPTESEVHLLSEPKRR